MEPRPVARCRVWGCTMKVVLGASAPSLPDKATDDATLFKHIEAGDLAALGTLYDRYHADVVAVVARAGLAPADLEEVVHETFLKLIDCAGKYDGRAAAKPWILGIAWRVAS